MSKRTPSDAIPLRDPWEAVTLSLVHANRYPCKPEWNIPLHTLTYSGLALCTHGRGWFEVAQQRFSLAPGSLIILMPGDRFAAGHDPSRPVTLLSVGAHMVAPGNANPLAQLNPPVQLSLARAEARAVAPLFTQLIDAHLTRSSANLLAARGAFMLLLARVLELAQSLPASRLIRLSRDAIADTRVQRACELIEARLHESLTLSDLAAVAHLTPPHFSLLFRNATGLAPMDYLRRRRIDRAKALLAQPQGKVESVSREVGFNDPYHFSRVFRRIVGVPPRVYAQSKRRPFFP